MVGVDCALGVRVDSHSARIDKNFFLSTQNNFLSTRIFVPPGGRQVPLANQIPSRLYGVDRKAFVKTHSEFCRASMDFCPMGELFYP